MSDRFEPGSVISQSFDIRIVEKIAEGGMGEVYDAVLLGASGFEKRIALKIIRSEITGVPSTETQAGRRRDFLDRFINEAKLVSNLIHTHIAQMYLLGMIGEPGREIGYIAMELVNGINLRSFIDKHLFEEKHVPVDIAVYIASRVARALEYAHNATGRGGDLLGIVHRDVSPTNIMVSIEGVVKLSDFGIAKVVADESHGRDYVAGKRRYMAPEQTQTGNVDFRADIYSLGLVLFELLTNRMPDPDLPFVSCSSFRGGVPAEIERILHRSTNRHPRERYGTTSELAVDLEKAIYDKGYGPTFVTMSNYLKDLFPALAVEMPQVGAEEATIIFDKTQQ